VPFGGHAFMVETNASTAKGDLWDLIELRPAWQEPRAAIRMDLSLTGWVSTINMMFGTRMCSYRRGDGLTSVHSFPGVCVTFGICSVFDPAPGDRLEGGAVNSEGCAQFAGFFDGLELDHVWC
jgi:hypothetical protein